MPAPTPLPSMAIVVAIADTGSFTAAARRHGLTPSGVSKAVARLERQLGVRLIERSTRRLTLTDDGARYCARARAILADVADLERELASRRAAPAGLVRVSASLLLGETVVMPSILAFQQRHPRVQVEVELSDRVIDFAEEPLDVAVRLASEAPRAAVARRVGVDRRVLCASPGYLRARPAPRLPRELVDHDCLAFTGRRAGTEWSLSAAPGSDERVHVPVRGRLRCNNIRSLHAAARAGMGIANLPLFLVADDLREGALAAVLDDHVPLDRSIYVLSPATRLLPAAVKALATHLATALAAAGLEATRLPAPAPRR